MRIIFLVFIILVAKPSFGQTSIGFNVGYGSFAMNDLKTIQQQMVNAFPVPPKVTSSFPPYYVYEFLVRVPLRHHMILQFSGEYGSTGGRMYYSDYSGSLGSNQLASYIALKGSFGFSHALDSSKKWLLQFYITEGISLNSVEMTSFETVGTATQSDRLDVSGVNTFIQPTVTITRRLNSRIGVDAFVGYHIDVYKGEMTTSGDISLFVNGRNATVDFSGFRIGLGVNYFFKTSRVDN